MPTTALTADFIEHVHDVLVGLFLPFDEKVDAAEYRSRALIESAVNRPLHTVGDKDLYETLPEKAAALFHSLACNHCFLNGNKRTAVIGLDVFLMMNLHLLTMTPADVYAMAIETVQANQKGVALSDLMPQISKRISESTISVQDFSENPEFFKRFDRQQIGKIVHHMLRSMRFTLKFVRMYQPTMESIDQIETQLQELAEAYPFPANQ